jgi:CRISPR/Cas system CMR subunit Cmr6 (Cas7 group RAMP superfamily)
MPKLLLFLASPLAVGTGAGRAGSVDRELPYDPETGVPYLGGKAIKGLLRDAYTEIFAAGAFPELPPPDEIFGFAAARTPGPVSISNAEPQGVAAAALWWRALARAGMIRPIEILQEFAETRRQTRLDRATGAPMKDTLRSARVLRAGLTLESTITLLTSPDSAERLLMALSLAALNLRRAGGGRNRGYGSLRCTLLADDQKTDLTSQAAQFLEGKRPFPPNGEPPTPASQPAQVGSATPAPGPQRTLTYRLTLSQPARLATSRQFNPNSSLAADVIPGTILRGVAAWNCIHQTGETSLFHRAFSEASALAFSDALPVSDALDPASRLPFSLRDSKENPGQLHDLAELAPSNFPEGGLRRLTGFYAPNAEDRYPLHRINVRKVLTGHHQRARDRRAQRALGAEEASLYYLSPGDQGALFSSESISAGQSFTGSVECPESLEPLLRQLLPEGQTISFGASRQAQFGGAAALQWLPATTEASAIPERNSQGHWILELLSPLIGWNEFGHPGPFFPASALHPDATVLRCFSRPEPAGGYSGHQNLPRARHTALAAGSVFVLQLPPDFDWAAAEQRRYGLRTTEGFGQVRFRRRLFSSLGNADEPLFPPTGDARRLFLPPPGTAPTAETLAPLLRLWKERALQHVVRNAFSQNPPATTGTMSRQLLRQFTTTLADPVAGIQNLTAQLNQLRAKANRHVESCRYHDVKNLKEYLLESMAAPEATLRHLLRNLPDVSQLSWRRVLNGGNPIDTLMADTAFVNQTLRLFLIAYLSQFARELSAAARGKKV